MAAAAAAAVASCEPEVVINLSVVSPSPLCSASRFCCSSL